MGHRHLLENQSEEVRRNDDSRSEEAQANLGKRAVLAVPPSRRRSRAPGGTRSRALGGPVREHAGPYRLLRDAGPCRLGRTTTFLLHVVWQVVTRTATAPLWWPCREAPCECALCHTSRWPLMVTMTTASGPLFSRTSSSRCRCYP